MLVYSCGYGRVIYSKFRAPLLKALGNAISGYFNRCAAIIRLFFVSCPPAIGFGISQCPVDSIARMVWRRPRTHVIKEFIEIQPAFIHGYSPVLVDVIGPFIRSEAPLLDSPPNDVFRKLVVSSGSAVGGVLGNKHFLLDAAARINGSLEEISLPYDLSGFVLAAALANPSAHAARVAFGKVLRAAFDYCQTAKFLAGKLLELIVRFIRHKDKGCISDMKSTVKVPSFTN